MPDFKEEYETHVSTWAPNCGAPAKVYIGHLERLLNAARADEREACAKIAEDHPGSWHTLGNECADIAAKIRERGVA